MTEMELLLNKEQKNIRHAVFYVESKYESWRLKEFLDHTNLDELILTGCISPRQAEEMIESLKCQTECQRRRIPNKLVFCPIEEVIRPEGEFALIFEILDDVTDILPMVKLQPTYLIGTIPEFGISSFRIWEVFKGCCKRIMIKTIRKNDPPQILDWTYNPENDIELSIVFPMYNVEKYLDQCIQSVTAWDANYIEFLFINDGSPDNSREVVLKYAEKDKRIKLLDKPNGGCASARQWGLDRAKGRYVGFIDPDDYIDESMYRKLLCAAMIGGYDISYCGYNEYYENTGTTKEVEDILWWPYNKGTSDLNYIHELIAYSRIAIWRGIYKMKMLRDNNIHFYTDLRRFDDLPFQMEVLLAAKSVIAVDEPLYYYRLARPGQDVSADDDRLYVHFPIFEYLNESIVSKKNAKVTDYLQIRKIQTHRYALEKIKPEYMEAYIRQARVDLNTTASFWRTLSIAKKMVGRRSSMYYWAIMRNHVSLIKWLNKSRKEL